MPESNQDHNDPNEVQLDREDAVSDASEDVVDAASPPARPGIFADPVVRRLSWLGGLMLVAFLAAVASALLFGVLNPPAPRTASERDLKLAETQIDAGSTEPEVWFSYISALISTDQYSKAERMINKARDAGYEDPAKQYLLVAQVRLDLAREEYQAALDDSDLAIQALEAQLVIEEEQFAGTKTPTVMIAEGLGENYETLLLNRAEAFENLGQSEDAIAALDEYLLKNERAADILVWRGDLKSAAGDTQGAISDYENASQYMPGDEEILKKLAELGATDG